MASGVVWGIDIGKASLKAVKARKTKDCIEILGLDYIDYGPMGDASESSDKVREAVRTFLERNQIRNESVAVALPGYTAFSRFIKLPPVEAKKIDEMVRYEAQQQIPFPIDEVNWDYQKIDRDYEPGEEVELGIFAIKKELIAGFLSELRMHGIEPDLVTIAPLAVYNFVTYNQNVHDAAVIVDIGAEHTDLVIVDGPRFWIRNLRIAGNDITKALQEKFKIPFAEAEKLKRTASKSKEAKKIFGVMEPVLKDFVGEVQRSIGFYKSQAKDLKIKKMILLGDGARLVNLKQFFQKELRYEVDRVSRLQESLVLDPEVDLNILKVHIPAFGVAFGLALQGCTESRNTINLLPQDLRIQSQLRQKKLTAVAAAVLSVIGLALFYFGNTKLQEKVVSAIQGAGAVEEYKKWEAKIEELKTQQEPLDAKIREKLVLTEGRLTTLELMNAIARAVSEDGGGLSRNAAVHPINDQLRRRRAFRQQEEVEKNFHKYEDAKLWLLSMDIQKGMGTVDWGDPGANKPPKQEECLIVELTFAKKLVDRDAKQTLTLFQEFLKTRLFAADKLKAPPFYARPVLDRDPGKDPWELEIQPEPPSKLWAHFPGMDKEADAPRMKYEMRQFKVRFEVGLAPPEKPAAEEGGETPKGG